MSITKRVLNREHMDDPQATRDELSESLRFIRLVNRRLGGTRAALRHFKRWARGWPKDEREPRSKSHSLPAISAQGDRELIRIIDIGTGSADIPLAIVRWARRAGHRVHITAVDLHPVTVDLARQYLTQQGGGGEIDIVQADARRLVDQFAPGSFDYAHAGMFLHHLADIDAMTVLRIMDRLTTRGLIWNDLVRLSFPRLWLWPLTMGAPAMVKHDAVVSVEAGFAKREAIDLARRAGLTNIAFRRHWIHRFTLVSEKR